MYDISELHSRHSWEKDGDEITLLDITLPRLGGVPKHVNAYYLLLEKRLKAFCRRRARAGDRSVYKADYTAALLGDDHISIYCDISRDGLVRARTACTWDAVTGYPLPLGHFTALSRRAVIGLIDRQIKNERYPIFFKDAVRRLSRFYDPDNFWIDEKGIWFFYQPLCLAPVEYGVQCFLL